MTFQQGNSGPSLYTLGSPQGTGDTSHLYGKPGGTQPTPGPGVQQFTPELPEWAGGQFADPAHFYSWYNGFADPSVRDSIVANMQSTYTADQRNQQAIRDAVSSIDSSRTLTQDAYSAWLNDPTFESVLETLRRRSSGEDPLIGDIERTARLNQAAQVYARTAGASEARAGASGTLRSAPTTHQSDAIQAYSDAAGLQLAANVENTNRGARDAALAATGQIIEGRENVNQGYLRSIGALDTARASTLASQQYTPTDFVPFAELDFARRAYDEALSRADREEQRLIDENASGLDDIFTTYILPLLGIPNVPGALASGLGF